MSQQLSCYHGHRFEVPQHAGEFALCPLCGALTRYRLGIGDTKGHEAHNQTLNQPHIPPLETSHDESAGKTLEIDEPHFIDQAHLQTGVFEQAAVHGGQKTPPDLEGAPEEVDDAPLSDVTPPDSSRNSPKLEAELNDSERVDESIVIPKTVVISKTVRLDEPTLDNVWRDESNLESND